MAHNRKFVPGMIDLVKVRFRNTREIVFIQDAIEKIIIDSGMLKDAPFKWIGLLYRYGIRNKLTPDYQRINKKYGDLPIAIELDSHVLKWADEHNLQLFQDIFMIAGLEAILHVCEKYNLPSEGIQKARSQYGNIPNSVEECEILYRVRE